MIPKISIIIPVYNGANYLREAIESALAQTYTNVEILVVNDGSMDRTTDIASQFGNKIRLINKKNGGVASALNVGIQNMTGEYFSWLSHDDIYYPEKLEKQMKALKDSKHMTAPLYGNWDILQMPQSEIRHIPRDYRFSTEQMENGVFPVLFGQVNGCTVLIHKSHFARVGLFDEKLFTSQDYDMFFRIFRGQRAVYVEEPLIAYRFHEEQGSKTDVEFMKNCDEIQMKMIDSVTDDEIETIFGGKYKFYTDMLDRSADCKFVNCYNEMKERLKKIPKQTSNNQNLKKVLGNNIVLFCAGKNGKRLCGDLEDRGIKVRAFSDNNSAIWGTVIDNHICISPSEIDKVNDTVIVTKDNPDDLVKELEGNGYYRVCSYRNLAHKIFMQFK